MTIAFTGHREYDAERTNDMLFSRLEELASEGEVTFLSGMAVGFDLAAAEVVIQLKENYHSVRLRCVVPFIDQPKYFSPDQRERYYRVLNMADEIEIIESNYSKLAYLRRNDYLVENADLVIAYFNNVNSGGTAYTVRRARKARVAVENLYPDPQLSLF